MLICPAATARLVTDRFGVQLFMSGVFGLLAALLGYTLAVWLPLWLGADFALNVAGMIAVASGLILVVTMIAAPRYGVIAQRRKGAV